LERIIIHFAKKEKQVLSVTQPEVIYALARVTKLLVFLCSLFKMPSKVGLQTKCSRPV